MRGVSREAFHSKMDDLYVIFKGKYTALNKEVEYRKEGGNQGNRVVKQIRSFVIIGLVLKINRNNAVFAAIRNFL